MTTNDDRTYLAVPYDEKDDARALGAKWDRQMKAWYVPAGTDLEAFAPWLPARDSVHIAVDTDPREEFAQALRESGFRISARHLTWSRPTCLLRMGTVCLNFAARM